MCFCNAVAGGILLEAVTSACVFWRSLRLAHSVLPALSDAIASMRRAVISSAGARTGTVDAVLALERSHDFLFGRGGIAPAPFKDIMATGDWIFQVLATSSWLASHFAAVLISGPPVTTAENKLGLWLCTPVVVAGVDDDSVLTSTIRDAGLAVPAYARRDAADEEWAVWMDGNGLVGLGACTPAVCVFMSFDVR